MFLIHILFLRNRQSGLYICTLNRGRIFISLVHTTRYIKNSICIYIPQNKNKKKGKIAPVQWLARHYDPLRQQGLNIEPYAECRNNELVDNMSLLIA